MIGVWTKINITMINLYLPVEDSLDKLTIKKKRMAGNIKILHIGTIVFFSSSHSFYVPR